MPHSSLISSAATDPAGAFWQAHDGPVGCRSGSGRSGTNRTFPPIWPTQPFAATYVALLEVGVGGDPERRSARPGRPRRACRTIRGSTSSTSTRVPGARGAFNVVAVHPYTATPAGVITILRYVRQVMDQNGDACQADHRRRDQLALVGRRARQHDRARHRHDAGRSGAQHRRDPADARRRSSRARVSRPSTTTRGRARRSHPAAVRLRGPV